MLSQENYQSIFNIIEEKEEEKDRTYFKWCQPIAELVTEGETVLYDGDLIYFSPKSPATSKTKHFILTRDHLIKLSVIFIYDYDV